MERVLFQSLQITTEFFSFICLIQGSDAKFIFSKLQQKNSIFLKKCLLMDSKNLFINSCALNPFFPVTRPFFVYIQKCYVHHHRMLNIAVINRISCTQGTLHTY